MTCPSAAALAELATRALADDRSRAVAALERLGFSDAERAVQGLDRLAGPGAGLASLPAAMLTALAHSGTPDRGLRNLERFVEVAGGGAALFSRLDHSAALRERLAALVSHGHFLTDILVRNPELLYWVLEGTPHLSQPMDSATLGAAVAEDVARARSPDEVPAALRRAQRRELLRIGASQVLGLKDVADIGRELADLADAMVEHALAAATAELAVRHGAPRDERGRAAHLCVVCLGKHGGRELNYSSDIDLLLVYDEEGQTRPRGDRGKSLPNAEYFTRVGERLIQILTEATDEGSLYRVDMRLRPEGEAGLLVRSLRSYWAYYESRGELWERQMLIKARRAAGSARVWERFRRMLQPFVYPAHFAVPPQEEIRRIKERIEAEIRERPERGNNIKLQAGGIRDIEFAVQCLQLLEGRTSRRACVRGTLEAIERLQELGALAAAEARSLSSAYRFLRQLENLLQIQEGRRAYAVPEEAAERHHLAAVLGLDSAAALEARLGEACARVRQVFESVFAGAEGDGEDPSWVLEARPGSPGAAAHLEKLGFADGAAAHRVLVEMAGRGDLTEGAKRSLRALLPDLLAGLIAAPDPDAGLTRFARLVGVYGAPGTFFDLVRSRAGFRSMLIALCGTSQHLAALLQADPGLLDALVGYGDDVPLGELPGDGVALRRAQVQHLLRLAADDLLGLAPAAETFRRLSDLAEGVLGTVWRRAWRQRAQRRGRPRTRRGEAAQCVCMAGGKLGSRELNFASDLDLFFVYQGQGRTGRGQDNAAFFAELAQDIIAALGEGGLYRVDARLRPEGAGAPVVISLAAYRRYLRQRAATWERLALLRVRPVAGDVELGRRVVADIRRFAWAAPLDAATLTEVASLRRRLEPVASRGSPGQSGPGATADIKRGAGGIVDVEFIAQVLMLHLSPAAVAAFGSETTEVLGALAAAGTLPESRAEALSEAYGRLRQVEKGLRLISGRSAAELPAGEALRVLARAVGAGDPGHLRRQVEELMARTRVLYERTMADLGRAVAGDPTPGEQSAQ